MRRGYYKRVNRRSKKLLIQLFICIMIVIAVISIKKADITMTNKVLEYIETGLSVEYNLKEVPSKTLAVAKKIPKVPQKIVGLFKKDENQYAFSPPVDQVEVISTFGNDYDPVTEQRSFQRGIDYYSPKPIDVYAIGDGVVTEIGNSNVYGDYIKITHNNDMFSIYGGCSSIYTEKSQNVKKGDILASVVSPDEDPNFFHFELWVNGEIVNPDEYIEFN